MVMPARPVGVAVGEFLGGGVADVHDLHVEIQRLPGERVVGVHGDVLVVHGDDGDDAGAVAALGGELHAGTDVGYACEPLARDGLNEGRILPAVGLVRGDGGL